MSVLLQFLGLIFTILCFYEIVLSKSVLSLSIINWLYIDIFDIKFCIFLDSLTCSMLLIIFSISLCVQVFSIEYMKSDPFIIRFFSYLSLFGFFMLFLVTSDNFLQLFIGWEGVGLCSFLLISFWYTRILAVKAAVKAMIVNRIADVFFMMAISLLFLVFKTLNFVIIFDLIPFFTLDIFHFFFFSVKKLDFICFLLFVGAIGKSAQLGLHIWLPDAMEGPTPVSALLHAATMVTAGIFLILKCSSIFEFSEFTLLLIVCSGGLTCFFSGIIGLFVYDIKKIIAYSTCSQLGYMFLTAGFSRYDVSFFHLFNHAFFKALLFLSAGSIIHSMKDEQDIRKMGGLINFLPFSFICFFIGSFAIMGFPFLTAFYSKDLILEICYYGRTYNWIGAPT
jgi:NADH-quinone oxidoreductase subunit L